ncbi:glycosyltransferase [Candidatus Uhrbacteria bacterium]|nr:glycosyltransferase [Candidatus Uhrbacteria bacterium]
MDKIACSVPILTLNAKAHLERLLPLVVPHVDDVFIMDGNSTDGTQEFARSLGVRVEKQFDTDEPNRRITDFRAMRLRLWSKAKHDWLFLLDADEEPTPEAIELVRRVVAEGDVSKVHRVLRLTRLPDGRVVKHALFYPYWYPNLFSLKSGVTIAERAVHERLVFPPDVRLVDDPVAIIDPQPSAREWGERQLRYRPLMAKNIPSTSYGYFWRWILWYHLRSFVGQLLKAVVATMNGWRLGEASLPWSYNFMFLRYYMLSYFMLTRAWLSERQRQRTTKFQGHVD